MSPEARERSFDELARGLASGEVSRGKALRLMGAALVGGVLASVPGVALAAPGPKKCGGQICPSGQVCLKGGGKPRCGCRPGNLVTPVGGGEPFCACFQSCAASCADCTGGTICATGEQEFCGSRLTCTEPCE